MSFFNNRGGGIFPGEIEGNPTNGLRHRVAVCVERILDSCMKQETAENTRLVLSGITLACPVPPYRFISASSIQVEANITDLTITRIPERPEFARVKCSINIPMRIIFEDSKEQKGSAESHIKVTEDVIMFVPRHSIFPFEVKAVASVNCPSGKISDEKIGTVTACYTVIMKITANTNLLIPTYGFCQMPRAVDFEARECEDFFDLPLYPSGR